MDADRLPLIVFFDRFAVNKQINPTRRQCAVLLFRGKQAHRKPAVLVAPKARERVVRVEAREPCVGSDVLRARPAVTGVAPVVERARTGHSSEVNIPGGRESTGDGLGSTGRPPRIITDSMDVPRKRMPQVNAINLQTVGIIIIITT